MTHVTVSCPCGSVMEMTEKKAERKKYCSNECKYRFRVRPSGLSYAKHVENPGWFQPGHESLRGEAHPGWRGDDVGYQELHRWVRTVRTLEGCCARCGDVGYTEWANLSHEYRRVPEDWIELCRMCHRAHDSGENRGLATAKYGQRALRGYREGAVT